MRSLHSVWPGQTRYLLNIQRDGGLRVSSNQRDFQLRTVEIAHLSACLADLKPGIWAIVSDLSDPLTDILNLAGVPRKTQLKVALARQNQRFPEHTLGCVAPCTGDPNHWLLQALPDPQHLLSGILASFLHTPHKVLHLLTPIQVLLAHQKTGQTEQVLWGCSTPHGILASLVVNGQIRFIRRLESSTSALSLHERLNGLQNTLYSNRLACRHRPLSIQTLPANQLGDDLEATFWQIQQLPRGFLPPTASNPKKKRIAASIVLLTGLACTAWLFAPAPDHPLPSVEAAILPPPIQELPSVEPEALITAPSQTTKATTNTGPSWIVRSDGLRLQWTPQESPAHAPE